MFHAADPSDVRFPSIEGLRAFEAVARLGSCERAADELAVTASAISKRVATLEDLLGTPLFSRSLRALSLTAAGREYLEQVRMALGLLAAVPLHRRQAQRVQRRRVSSPPTPRSRWRSSCRFPTSTAGRPTPMSRSAMGMRRRPASIR